MVAAKFPSWSVGREHEGTIVGGLVNLGVSGVVFRPSGDYESFGFGGTLKKRGKPTQKTDAASVTAARIARHGQRIGRRSF